MDSLIHEYPDIEKYLEAIKNNEESEPYYNDNCLFIKVNLIDKVIKIHNSQLDKICNGEEADKIPSFKYLGSYGIKFKNYYEICVSISHPIYSFFDDANEWKTKPLNFKINNNKYEVSAISDLMVLLTEPIYTDNNSGWYDFHNFTSIKFSIDSNLDYKTEFCKALFYLNSYYLKTIGFNASLMYLELNDEDPLEIMYENDIEDVFETVSKEQDIIKKDFFNIEPLNLYNEAVKKKDEQRFLLLYRILEFFMDRAIRTKIANMRYNQNITEEQILKSINLKNEEQQLKTLFNEVLDDDDKVKISNYCFNNNLISINKFEKVFLSIYKYRNSLVHAKEKEINQTTFPNPFIEDKLLHNWINVIDEISIKCISKYNEK
jgi:hypothetical protein